MKNMKNIDNIHSLEHTVAEEVKRAGRSSFDG